MTTHRARLRLSAASSPLGNGLVRSIHEDETERGIAKIRADALREAESALRVMDQDSPYSEVSRGQCADGWGNAMGDIDHGYADWLRDRANRIEEES